MSEYDAAVKVVESVENKMEKLGFSEDTYTGGLIL